jgi:phosphate-selective porin OprO/OprP
MRGFRSNHAAALAAFAILVAAALPSNAGDATIEDGASIESAVRDVLGLQHVTFGGRLFNDWMEWASVDESLETAVGEDAFVGGTEFRAARVQMKGEVSDRIGFFIDYDFAGGKASLKDAYIEFGGISNLGNIRVGHIREPFGLEGLTSSKYTTFMEFALPSAFFPFRNTGLMLHNAVLDERVTWAAGVFRDAGSFGEGSGEDEFCYTARLTGTPLSSESGTRMVQIGASATQRNPDASTARFKSAGENHMGPVLVDTGDITVESLTEFGVEAAVVFGPLLVQGEFVQVSADRVPQATPSEPNLRGCCDDPVDFSGYYIQASWMLTRESHSFSQGVPSRLKPRQPLGEEGGRGALELAVRFSGIDLTDLGAGVDGGELTDTTFGINWYMTGNSRIMLNYVVSDYAGPDVEAREGGVDGSAAALMMRFQIDF